VRFPAIWRLGISQETIAYPPSSPSENLGVRCPIDFTTSEVRVRVEGSNEHGIAAIGDADVMI